MSSFARISIPALPQKIGEFLTSVAILNVFFLAGTGFWITYYRTFENPTWDSLPPIKYLAIQFNLGQENVLASWYSSMLLLALALLALICMIADLKHSHQKRVRQLSYGWLPVIAIFLILSFDEMGSFHERIGFLSGLKSLVRESPFWEFLLKLMLGSVAGVMALWTWLVMRRFPFVLQLFALGVMFLICVDLFERIEPLIWKESLGQTSQNKPISFTLFEEGGEIFCWLSMQGALAIYAIGTVQQSLGVTKQNLHAPQRALQVEWSIPRKPIFLATSILLVLLGGTMLFFQAINLQALSGDVGIPENWFPSALAAIAALVSLQLSYTAIPSAQHRRIVYGVSSLFLLMLSMYYGASMPGWRFDLWKHNFWIGLLFDISLSLMAGIVAIVLAVYAKARWSQMAAIAWAVLLSLALFGVGRYYKAGFVDFVSFAFLLLALLEHLPEWETRSEVAHTENMPDIVTDYDALEGYSNPSF